MVTIPDAGVLFTGDLVEAGQFAIFPWFPPYDTDMSGLRWIEVIRRLVATDRTWWCQATAQLPAAVLSQLLGLHLQTATAWTIEAGNTRLRYAAAVAIQPEPQPSALHTTVVSQRTPSSKN